MQLDESLLLVTYPTIPSYLHINKVKLNTKSKIAFLSASLYFSKRGTNRKPYPRNSMVQLSTPWGHP